MRSGVWSSRLPRHRALVAVGAAVLLAACSSSGGAAPRTSAGSSSGVPATSASMAPTASSAPAPSSPAEQPLVRMLPQPPAPIVKRTVSRPAGLAQVDGVVCLGEAPSGAVEALLKTALTAESTHAEQVNQVSAASGAAKVGLAGTEKFLAALRAKGYPSSFPFVATAIEMKGLLSQVITAAQSGDLSSIPTVYSKLVTLNAQENADSDSAYQSGRDVCTH